jgi:hypothetical protein
MQKEVLQCIRLDPFKEINRAERSMMYNNSICCRNGHRDNILDPHHTDVSIGIAFDRYFFAFVQNFENNYINFSNPLIHNNKHIQISGKISSGKLDTIGVYYDENPSHLTYQENKDKNSYKLGEFVASIVQPPPLFSIYDQPSNYTLIRADNWSQNGRLINVTFDLSPILRREGVYTIVVYLNDNEEDRFPVTSYSTFVQ